MDASATTTPAPDPRTEAGTGGFVISLIGLFLFPLLCLFGLMMSYDARRKVRDAPERYRAAGVLGAGLVLGWIGVVFLALAVITAIVLLAGIVIEFE